MRKVANTVRCQFHNSDEGRRLAKLDPAAHASLEAQLAGNIVQLVKVIVEDATGTEY